MGSLHQVWLRNRSKHSVWNGEWHIQLMLKDRASQIVGKIMNKTLSTTAPCSTLLASPPPLCFHGFPYFFKSPGDKWASPSMFSFDCSHCLWHLWPVQAKASRTNRNDTYFRQGMSQSSCSRESQGCALPGQRSSTHSCMVAARFAEAYPLFQYSGGWGKRMESSRPMCYIRKSCTKQNKTHNQNNSYNNKW